MKYSILLPTYNERENLPIILWLINDVMTKCDFDYEVIVIGKVLKSFNLNFLDVSFIIVVKKREYDL